MHEQSETVQRLVDWYNVYGKRTPQAGQVLPPAFPFERPSYPTAQDAEFAAKWRSLLTGPDHQPRSLGWLDVLRMLTPPPAPDVPNGGLGGLAPPPGR